MPKKISIYERGAPKFDVYTTEVWDKEYKRRSDRRCFASFGDAYSWGLKQINFNKDSPGFHIIGEKFKRRLSRGKDYEKTLKNWVNKPFNRMDCEEVCWYFNKACELESRCYDYYSIGFEYMPSDTEASAGIHFKRGDFVKVRDTVFVVSGVPGKKGDNRWENYYTVIEVIKKSRRIYTSHTHFHESDLVKFTEPINKSGPLWFLHQVFSGKIKLTKEQQDNVVDAEIKLVDGEFSIL